MFLIDNQNRNRSGPSQIELRSAVEMMRSISTFINNNNSKKRNILAQLLQITNCSVTVSQCQCYCRDKCESVTVSQRSTRSIFSTSRGEWEFLLYNLAHGNETRISGISDFETRPRKIFFLEQIGFIIFNLRREQNQGW